MAPPSPPPPPPPPAHFIPGCSLLVNLCLYGSPASHPRAASCASSFPTLYTHLPFALVAAYAPLRCFRMHVPRGAKDALPSRPSGRPAPALRAFARAPREPRWHCVFGCRARYERNINSSVRSTGLGLFPPDSASLRVLHDQCFMGLRRNTDGLRTAGQALGEDGAPPNTRLGVRGGAARWPVVRVVKVAGAGGSLERSREASGGVAAEGMAGGGGRHVSSRFLVMIGPFAFALRPCIRSAHLSEC